MFRPLALAALAALPIAAQVVTPLPSPTAPADTAIVDTAAASGTSSVQAAGDTVEYEASRIRFRNDRFVLAEGALLKYQGSTLKADSIVYYADLDIVEAFGAPLIEDPLNPAILGYQMRYNLRNRVGTVYYGSSVQDGHFFNGNEVRRQPDGSVYLARADLSTCDEHPGPHYHFYARRMIVQPQRQVLSGPIVMNIADVPVAVLPMMVMPLGTGRRSGMLTPRFGGDQTQGYFLQNLGYYWAISDYQDLQLSADIVEGENGTFDQTHFNGTYQWNKRYVWNGMVGGRLYVPEFQPERAGGYVDFRNDLNITPDGRQTLKGSGRIQSDPEIVQRNSYTEEDRLQQTANANLGYRRQFDRANAVLNIEASQEHNLTQDNLNRSLPNATFSASGPLIPVSEEARAAGRDDAWYHSWTWNYSNRFNIHEVRRAEFAGRAGDTAQYAGFTDQATLSGKYTAFNYFNLTPSLNASQLWSAGARGDSLNPYVNDFNPAEGQLGQYFFAWNASLRADTRIYGIAQMEDHPFLGRVTAARHTITPAISLTYAPELDSNTRFAPNPRIGGTAYQAERREVGFQLGNDVDLKVAPAGAGDSAAAKAQSYKLMTTNSGINYNFARDVRPWSDLSSNVNLYLTRNVALNINASHRVYDEFADPEGYRTLDPTSPANRETAPILQSWGFGWRRGFEIGGGLNTGLRMRDTQGAPTTEFEQSPWSVSLNYSFDFRANRVGTTGGGNPAEKFLGTSEIFNVTRTHQANGGFRLSPTSNWHMTYNTEFNFTEGEFSRHNFGFERTIHCWQMNFSWTPVGVAQGWYFMIRIIDLPDIKLEARDTRAI